MNTAASKPAAVDRPETDRWAGRFVMLARVLFALSILMTLVGVIVRNALSGPLNLESGAMDAILPIALVVPAGIVGLLIVSRYPRHTVGWLMLMLSLSFAQFGFLGIFGAIFGYQLTNASNPAVLFLAWTGRWIWLAAPIIPLMIIPLYFPDGRLLSRRWRFAAAVAILGLFTGMASYAIDPDPVEMAPDLLVPNPYQFGADAALADFMWQYVATPLLSIGLIAALVSVILRYRRSKGVQRAQMKWVLYVIVLSIGLSSLSSWLGSMSPVLRAVHAKIADPLVWFETIALSVTIGISILRYRLYDIDLIIRKTLVYSLLTALLALIYLGNVVLLQGIFGRLTGEQSPIIIVLSTLLLAALFAPLRHRVQELIDRRFYRRKYEARQVLARFARTARDEVELDELTAELVRVVEETMQPAAVSLWLKAGQLDRRPSMSVVER